MKIVLPEFALSHFDATKHQPAIPDITPEQFEKEINLRQPVLVSTGYASFCKLLYFKNWTNAQAGITSITTEILPFIRSEYEARRETELPVLMRYLPGDIIDLVAEYLCVIVYDKAQMKKEGSEIDGDFAVVNILRLMTLEEPPLPPITMMRNALGVTEGGSGVSLDREKYMASVEFWTRNVAVKPRSIAKGL